MDQRRHKFQPAAVIGAIVLLGALGQGNIPAASAVSPSAEQGVEKNEFDPRKLRGYGTLEGSLRRLSSGSVLGIRCESAEKARLVQAKYLSDLQSLPGVEAAKIGQISTFNVASQGSVAALCDGNKVTILAAATAEALKSLVRESKAAGGSTVQASVPMYLDRWDKYCFRHYYWPFQLPKGATEQNYDFAHEFDYAKAQERSGMSFWSMAMASDTAEGMMNYGYWDWAAQEAGKRQLPVSIGLGGRAGFEPGWLLSRYRDQNQLKMPGFTGNFHTLMTPYLGGTGVMSWDATTGQDMLLSMMQDSVRRYAAMPNVVSFMESHQETRHGDQDVFLEYGEVTDAAYRTYLKQTYGTVEKVAARWGMPIKSWDDVHVKEIAAFSGWGPKAIGMGESWRIGYEPLLEAISEENNWYNQRTARKTKPAPAEWFGESFDDSSWPEIPGAGHDRQVFLERRPAVFRCKFDVPADWKAANQRFWLYVWDLNLAAGQDVRAVINGKEVGSDKISDTIHWAAFEVTDAIKAGKNTLAIRTPQGYIAYRTYLSATEPRKYPMLGDSLNAQWVDFVDFTRWSRVAAIRKGMEAIRQVTPDHPITLAAPHANVDGLKLLAEQYGGEFHDTGFMGAVWYDMLPSMMRGADLPFSLENGEPPVDLAEFKKHLGHWQTEGVQSIDYYIHIGSIMWQPDVMKEYESQRHQLGMLGRVHYPKAEIATLVSDRVAALTQFPWSKNYFTRQEMSWNAQADLRQRFPYDILTQSSFAGGDADAYRMIIDANTSVMDEALVADIEKWVRDGGVFVAVAHTGRHTSTSPDAWPISRLTGYRVVDADHAGQLKAATSQNLFKGTWTGAKAKGLSLVKAGTDVKDLLLWNDGTSAAGMRPLGKGYLVCLGALPGGGSGTFRDMLDALLAWREIKPEPARLNPANGNVILRCAVSNNGLYDVWTIWNQSPKTTQSVTIELLDGRKPAFAFDVRADQRIAVAGGKLPQVTLQPLETRVYLTPRGKISESPAAWFDLQRKWWRGTTKPDPKPLPEVTHRWARDLSDGWKVKFLDDAADGRSLLAVDYKDGDWATRRLGVWNVKDDGQGKGHAIFRKSFVVPAEWNDGKTSLWLTSWVGPAFVGTGRVWLDGKEVKQADGNGYVANPLESLKAGSTHSLAVEAQNKGVLAGLRGDCWISYEPAPLRKIDLAGQWSTSQDGLKFDGSVTLPGKLDSLFLKRSVFIDEANRGKDVMLAVDGDRRMICALINGHLVRRHHHLIAERASLNVTPFVKFGQTNEIELVRWDMPGGTAYWAAPGKNVLRDVMMGIYEPKTYP